eukprot:3714621-Alexandrium_andersonii.AAC.1
MSASLVGSEMCIRDRATNMVKQTAGKREALGPGNLSSRVAAHGGRPVSYTHLTLPTICSV